MGRIGDTSIHERRSFASIHWKNRLLLNAGWIVSTSMAGTSPAMTLAVADGVTRLDA